MGNRPVTLCTCQWADLPFDELCALASKMGYDGLEVACWGMASTLIVHTAMTATWPGSRRPWRRTT